MLDAKALITVALVGGLAGAAGAVIALRIVDGSSAGEIAQTLDAMQDRIDRLEAGPGRTSAIGPSRQPQPVQAQAPVGAMEPRDEAVVAVGDRSRGRADFRGFRELMDESADPETRLAQARELLKTSGPARFAAVRTLIDLHDPQALEAVKDLVDEVASEVDNDRRAWPIAGAVVEMLSSVEGSAVDAQLYEYLLHDDRSVRIAAAKSLESRGDGNPMGRIVDELAQGLNSADGGARSRAAQELGRTQSASAVAPLTAALNDKNSEVRLRAVQGLGMTGADTAIPALTAALEDPVAEVRSAASRGLDQIRNPRADIGFAVRGPGRFFGRP